MFFVKATPLVYADGAAFQFWKRVKKQAVDRDAGKCISAGIQGNKLGSMPVRGLYPAEAGKAGGPHGFIKF